MKRHKRLLVHLSFWLLWFLISFSESVIKQHESHLLWFVQQTFLLGLTYSNIYLLVPNFYVKRRYSYYFMSIFLILMFFVGVQSSLFQEKSILSKNNYTLEYLHLPIIFLLVSSGISIDSLNKKNELQTKKLENKQLQAELALLKSQINAHFLFNTLNNLYGLIIHQQNHKASEITLRLSDLMRYMLESSKIEKVSLKKEVKFMKDYLELERIRLSDKVDIQFDIIGLEKDYLIEPLLFIPLLENAFKHGLQCSNLNSFARFLLVVQENEIFFEVQNSTHSLYLLAEQGEGGLKKLQKRLEVIFPHKHLLEIQHQGNIFTVTMQITL